MAFPRFSKAAPKPRQVTPAAPQPAPAPRPSAQPAPRAPASARELAASVLGKAAPQAPARPESRPPDEGEVTMTGPPSLIEWASAGPSIQVAEANPGLCAVVENAALLFANGQSREARQVLEDGVANDVDAKSSPLAWLALFDALRRECDRAAFDQLSLQYVVEFERSPPSWEEMGSHERASGRPAAAGFAALTGKLTAANASQIASVMAATFKQPQVRLDVGALTGADDAGAKLLADALAELRKRRYALVLQHTEKLKRALESAVAQGRGAGEGYWTLLLELLQWEHDHVSFEDRALEFAVTFEVSPPSWEPPPRVQAVPSAVAGAQTVGATLASGKATGSARGDALLWEGPMQGANDRQLARFAEFCSDRVVVTVDMSAVERIDFVCAGALFNAISRAENQRKAVQIVGASPLIRALLLLLGISPRHFVKKPA